LRAVALTDAIAGINAQPGDADRALDEIRKAGGEFATKPGNITLRSGVLF